MNDPSPTHPRSVRQWIWRSLWPVALAATIFHASGQSEVAGPPGFIGLDKFVHFSVFGLLATLSMRVLFDVRHPARTALIGAALVSLYGMVDEIRQSFTPGRSVEVLDWIADTSGAALAVLAYSFWGPWRRLMDRPVIVRAGNVRVTAAVAAAAEPVRNETTP